MILIREGFVIELLKDDEFSWHEISSNSSRVSPNLPPWNKTSWEEMYSHFIKDDKKYFEDLFWKYFEWENSENGREKPKFIKIFDMVELYEHNKRVGVDDERKKYKRNRLDNIIQKGYYAKMVYSEY